MIRPPAFIGIDGSSTGALVALADDGATVLAVQQWRDELAPALAVVPGDLVALEGIHSRPGRSLDSFAALAGWRALAVSRFPSPLHPPGRTPRAVRPDQRGAALAAFVGESLELAGGLSAFRASLVASGRVLLVQPQPSTWRGPLGLGGGLRRDDAKAAALALARRDGRGLPAELTDHVAEAWCLARFVWLLTQARRRAAGRRRAA